MYNIRPTTKFQKDLKRVKKRGFDISLLTDTIKKLAAGEPLPEKNKDHQLSGNYVGCRECHITPDWLLIYEVDGDELILSYNSLRAGKPMVSTVRMIARALFNCRYKFEYHLQM